MKILLGISNRHLHLTEEDYKVLFGEEEIEKIKDLVQPGEFATDKKVTIKTPKATIANVRLLGPLRKYTQVEISKTDSYVLGINPPVRNSGDLDGAETITLVGPKGEVTKENACIIATRHIHITSADRKRFNLEDKMFVKVRVNSEKPTVFEEVHLKESDSYALEFHIDTDDGNGVLAKTGDYAEIIVD